MRTGCRRSPSGVSEADLALANSGFGYVDVGSGPPSETLLDIENSGVRMTLRDIQQDPAYEEIISDCLDEVEGLVRDREGGMTSRAGYLFISAPASTTPMHFDVEHSFLLQVRGVKQVSVASFADDPSARHRELDRYLDGEECDFEAMQAAAETTRMERGVGVYLPSYVPHWVETESGVSVSFSIPFFTAYTERTEGVSRGSTRGCAGCTCRRGLRASRHRWTRLRRRSTDPGRSCRTRARRRRSSRPARGRQGRPGRRWW